MRREETNSGPALVFTPDECEHWAFVCSCLPTDKMGHKELNFIRRMDAKFRGTRGAYLTPPQFEWLQAIAAKWKHLIPDL